MRKPKILILDYSENKIEATAIKRCLPRDFYIKTLFINTKESFPNNLKEQEFTHVIHSGSSLSINETAPFTKKAVKYIQDIRSSGVSQFGICYGHQLICLALVGKHAVQASPNGLEIGWVDVTFTNHAMDILRIRKNEVLWQSHFDEVTKLPDNSEVIATNSHTKIQAYINLEQKIIGTQFHPEFDKASGDKLFLNDKELLEKNNFNIDEILIRKPTIDAGKIFFGYFLKNI